MDSQKLKFLYRWFWPRRLEIQVVLLTTILFTLGIAFFSAYVFREHAAVMVQLITRNGQALAKNIEQTGNTSLFSSEHKQLQSLLEQLINYPDVNRLDVIDRDGSILDEATRAGNRRAGVTHEKPHYVLPTNTSRNTIRKTQDRVVIWYPVINEMGQRWIRVEMSLAKILSQQTQHYRQLLILGAAIIMVMLLVITLFMKSPMRAMATLTKFAKQLDKKKGEVVNINVKCEELNKLCAALNKVSVELQLQEAGIQAVMKTLETQKAALDQHSIVSITDARGVITYANDKFCQVSGYSQDELIGQTHRIVKSNMHNAAFFQELWKTISSGNTWQGEMCNRKKNGDNYWLDVTIVPFLSNSGKPYQYVAIRTEITRLRELTIALKESQERLQQSQVFSNTGSWEWQLSNDLITWSEQAAKIFGQEDGRLEMSFAQYIEAINPKDQAKVIEAVDACLQQGKDYEVEYRITRPDGSVHWLQEKGNVECDEQGKPVRMLGIVQDITQQHQSEKLNTRIGRILDTAFDEIYLFDVADLCLIQANSRALSNLGFTQDEVIGQALETLFVDMPNETFRQIVPDLYRKVQNEVAFESNMTRKDGSQYSVEVRVQVLPHEEPPLFLLVARDITRRKAAEENLRSAEEQLRQAQKIEAIGTMAGGIAHDFNNILTAIIGFAELNLMDMEPDSDAWKNQNQILTASYRARDIVKQILDYSRKSSDKPQIFKPGRIVVEANKLLKATIGATIKLVCEDVDMTSIINMSSTQFHQIILNLSMNASHAIGDAKGGVITISLRQDSFDQEQTVVGGVIPEGDYVNLEIIDNGSGIDSETLPRIFDPFFTTKPVGEGTGMGLSAVYGIVNKAGGGINVISTKGEGTKFSIYIPCMKLDAKVSKN